MTHVNAHTQNQSIKRFQSVQMVFNCALLISDWGGYASLLISSIKEEKEPRQDLSSSLQRQWRMVFSLLVHAWVLCKCQHPQAAV